MNNDPWGLSMYEAKALDLICELGCVKKVAQRLNREGVTISTHLWRARKKMGVRTTILAVLLWDRQKRGSGAANLLHYEAHAVRMRWDDASDRWVRAAP